MDGGTFQNTWDVLKKNRAHVESPVLSPHQQTKGKRPAELPGVDLQPVSLELHISPSAASPRWSPSAPQRKWGALTLPMSSYRP